ncbi:MAG: 2,3-bisphosphoglycerate-independent phosphoglycerate mutase [Planctomycetota bacterium]|nr:2,3-bisphosphoglycerate-independent phosphoglycerate mutase [Planctomycetota bacterium]
MKDKPLVLIIMDGWGVNPRVESNAIRLASTPHTSSMERDFPTTRLLCSGRDVGLPPGLMGNSEVGHLNLGAGRIVWQEITLIDRHIEDGSFFENKALSAAVRHALSNGSSLHLMGLVSNGGVHSSDNHYFALLQMAKRCGVPSGKVLFHAFLDGRDTPPASGLEFVKALEAKMTEIGVGRIASVAGRYYPMDRDKRWDRTQRGCDCLTQGIGQKADSATAAVSGAYARGETDEFVQPTVIVEPDGSPRGVMKDGDAVIYFNFRADRARQLTRALTEPDFKEFQRAAFPTVKLVTMTEYDKTFSAPVAFPPVNLSNVLGKVISDAGMAQLRIAETEKYAHVTYFFNGGEETAFKGEDRILVQSPKVKTYDLQPEMSAFEVTKNALAAIDACSHDFYVINFANGDMVGHTGILAAAIKAVETVDSCVGEVVAAVLRKKGTALVTSDHGNCEQMIDYETNQPHTYHTTNPVPLTLVQTDGRKPLLRPSGRLCDVAPTILHHLKLGVPAEMQGESLLG